jgi:diguanylate cyclase (GGDEF)-like protein
MPTAASAPAPMFLDQEIPESFPPDKFVVEVFSELSQQTVQQRWRDVNVVLRLSMLSGLRLELEATLNMLCDFAGEICTFERALAYFWEEAAEQVQLQVLRGFEGNGLDAIERGNILNFWAAKYGKPMLISPGFNVQADALLANVGAQSALIVPLMVNNRALGSLQLFSPEPEAFTREDAQLLWILALVAENQLNREYDNDGLLRFAFTDYLTGLRTRGYFEQQLELEFKRAERKKQSFALVMLDLDFFKQLNDSYGHHIGDQVLRDVAALLMKDMREIDTVARYGGEEFVIILPETTRAGAIFVAERLRRTIEQSKFFAGSPSAVERLTISVGIAMYDEDAQFKRDLIECADAALYAAKARGRNQVLVYSEVAQRRRKEVS